MRMRLGSKVVKVDVVKPNDVCPVTNPMSRAKASASMIADRLSPFMVGHATGFALLASSQEKPLRNMLRGAGSSEQEAVTFRTW